MSVLVLGCILVGFLVVLIVAGTVLLDRGFRRD